MCQKRVRTIEIVTVALAVAWLASLASMPANGQAAPADKKAAPKPVMPSKTPDGQPDIQGIYARGASMASPPMSANRTAPRVRKIRWKTPGLAGLRMGSECVTTMAKQATRISTRAVRWAPSRWPALLQPRLRALA